jgi:hypothetical protein
MDEKLIVEIESVKNMLYDAATYGHQITENNPDYIQIRKALIANSKIKDKLPRFIQTCRSLQEFNSSMKEQIPNNYKGRREFIRTEFEPVLNFLEGITIAESSGQPTTNAINTADKTTEPLSDVRKAEVVATPSNTSATIIHYDVALSFAGENRPYVKEVAEHLKQSGVNVFYDEFTEVDAWGKDLTEHFDNIFRFRADYCVMFISKAYVEKPWTTFEKRSALAKAIELKREYILPVRFDDTDLPGVSSSIQYVSASKKSPQDLAEMIRQKTGK